MSFKIFLKSLKSKLRRKKSRKINIFPVFLRNEKIILRGFRANFAQTPAPLH